jgi:hypothetical protein
MEEAKEKVEAIIIEPQELKINTNPFNRMYLVGKLIKCMIIDEKDKTCREHLVRALEKVEEASEELEIASKYHKIQVFTTKELKERWERPEWAEFKKLSEEIE